ncbi:hypothetical protein B0H11DRAFT_2228989 [Mycena galericulata]|nr:hypothetical protein B0H11DRAFT_2228989 [Mycena galericulata]
MLLKLSCLVAGGGRDVDVDLGAPRTTHGAGCIKSQRRMPMACTIRRGPPTLHLPARTTPSPCIRHPDGYPSTLSLSSPPPTPSHARRDPAPGDALPRLQALAATSTATPGLRAPRRPPCAAVALQLSLYTEMGYPCAGQNSTLGEGSGSGMGVGHSWDGMEMRCGEWDRARTARVVARPFPLRVDGGYGETDAIPPIESNREVLRTRAGAAAEYQYRPDDSPVLPARTSDSDAQHSRTSRLRPPPAVDFPPAPSAFRYAPLPSSHTAPRPVLTRT